MLYDYFIHCSSVICRCSCIVIRYFFCNMFLVDMSSNTIFFCSIYIIILFIFIYNIIIFFYKAFYNILSLYTICINHSCNLSLRYFYHWTIIRNFCFNFSINVCSNITCFCSFFEHISINV